MSLTFICRNYTCKCCGHNGRSSLVIKTTNEVALYFPSDRRPETLSECKLYTERIERDDYDIVFRKTAEEYPCDKCKSTDIEAEGLVKWDNVLNFFPPEEHQRWFEGFARHMS